jgi:hypothetical protein
LSAVVEAHATHELPLVPHAENDEVVHAPPVQHPFGHDVELHTHDPPEQTWPAPHMGDDPHLHAPEVEQLSAFVGSQAVHAAPATPHVASTEVSHVAPAQHPLGQLEAVQPVHTPEVHVCPPGQGWHAEPPVPHAAVVSPGWQLVPAQHPFGHDVELQMHVPPEQICPAAHAA